MGVFSPTDTIAAIATAPARAGIGVVRISGPLALACARAILTVTHDLEPRRATLTHVRAAPASWSHVQVPSAAPKPALRPFGNLRAAPSNVEGRLAAARPGRAGRPLGEGGTPESPPSPSGQLGGFGEAGRVPSPEPARPIDQVVATFFPAPHSYTAEDVVEISAHGSMTLMREILMSAMAAGARLAEPGEFTLRAFLNGRLDLVQAEAVVDLVEAATPLQARAAFDQLEGTLTRAIGAIDRDLFDLAARLEASVDFPDEGYHFVEPGEAAAVVRRVLGGIDDLLATCARGRVIREGRQIAILGKPNVGKSSLFNQLLGTDRAIVTAKPGTTRDMLTETIDLDGIRLGLVDTAGIRASGDEIEREGVSRARRAAEVADLVILVLDRSRPLEDVDRDLLAETAAASRLVVVNKCDLPAAWEPGALIAVEAPRENPPLGPAHAGRQDASPGSGRRPAGPPFSTPPGLRPLRSVLQTEADRPGSRALAGDSPAARFVAETGFVLRGEEPVWRPLTLSLKSGAGVDDLRAAMHAALDGGELVRDAPMVTNVRHEALLRDARDSVERALASLEAGGESASEELVLADLALARRALEEVSGKRTTEDVLRRIFERFCVGK